MSRWRRAWWGCTWVSACPRTTTTPAAPTRPATPGCSTRCSTGAWRWRPGPTRCCSPVWRTTTRSWSRWPRPRQPRPPRCGPRPSLIGSEDVILDDTPDRLGSLAEPAAAALDELAGRDAVARTWAGDHTLWRDDPTEISDRLGWLPVVADMRAGLGDLTTRVRALAVGVDHVLVAGMGGSSLFPEVVARHAPVAAGSPELVVLATTDPAAVTRAGAELAPETTLVVAASKSGSTVETRSHLAWAWDRHPDPARYAVITDPGSSLAALAAKRGFAATFENPPDIGGRYSALSLFGLVPTLLAGAPAAPPLAVAASTSQRLRGRGGAAPDARA